eukprot:s1879_g17.t1
MEGEPPGVQTYVLPLLSRPGGFLAAIPEKLLSSDLLLDAMTVEEGGVLGPSREFNAQLQVEEEIGSGIVDLESTTNFLVIDLDDSVFLAMREYDIVTDSQEPIVPFDADEPNALPKLAPVVPLVLEWIETVALERLNFYSAREEQVERQTPVTKRATAKRTPKATLASLASQLAAMQQQLQVVTAQQEALVKTGAPTEGYANHAPEPHVGPPTGKVPSLSAGLTGATAPKTAAMLLGPPPRTKQTAVQPAPSVEVPAAPIPGQCASSGEAQMFNTLSQQSAALTQLVAHFTGGDPLSELAGGLGSQGLGLSTKGVARREKMQQDLATGSSTYFLQVQQQLYKRMNPSRAIPKSSSELAQADVSMTAYLERYGGYRSCKETGLIMWILAHAVDSAARDDFHMTKEYLALLSASLEQSALDGSWNLAYLLALMEEPPQQLFADRLQPVSATGRPFSPMVPPSWAAVSLSYLKEIEVLTTRKTEAKKPATAVPQAANNPDPSPASPKRKPRFPKKPKAGAESP